MPSSVCTASGGIGKPSRPQTSTLMAAAVWRINSFFRDTGIGGFCSRHHDFRRQALQKFLRGYVGAEYQLLTLSIIAEPFDFVFRQNRDR